jgi:hypothetical protein
MTDAQLAKTLRKAAETLKDDIKRFPVMLLLIMAAERIEGLKSDDY